mgnify:CR=1 FL=1
MGSTIETVWDDITSVADDVGDIDGEVEDAFGGSEFGEFAGEVETTARDTAAGAQGAEEEIVRRRAEQRTGFALTPTTAILGGAALFLRATRG